jgi:hypothetical protein
LLEVNDEREEDGRAVGREKNERLPTLLDERLVSGCTIGVRAGAGEETTYDDEGLREVP